MKKAAQTKLPTPVLPWVAMVVFLAAQTSQAQLPPINWFSIAGLNTISGTNDGGNGSDRFNTPYGVAADTNGNIFVADSFNQSIRKLTPSGTNWISSTLFTGIQYPLGIAVDANSNIYVSATINCTITEYSPTANGWTTNILAGSNGVSGSVDGTNNAALFNGPQGLALDTNGNIYVADTGNHTIRKLTFTNANWVSSTLAGAARTNGTADGTNSVARFNLPEGLTVATNGTIYVADSGNLTIRKLVPSGTNWITTTIAGTAASSGSTDGTNKNSRFGNPTGVALDATGNIYVADAGNSIIRKLSLSGTNWISSTVGGTNSHMPFNQPRGIAVDNRGVFYMANTGADNVWLGAPNYQIQSAIQTNSVLTVTWTAIAGFTYQLQYKTNFTQTIWSNAGAAVTATNIIASATDTNNGTGQRFYRVMWQP